MPPEQHLDPGTGLPETQVFVASTVYAVATLAAAIDDGAFGPARQRLLVLSNNAQVPETATPLTEMAGFEQLARRFDRVVSYNEAIAPMHPSAWGPRASDTPIWERYFRNLWALEDDHVRLVVETIHAWPAIAICHIFCDAAITVYSDGLMSYGPTRKGLPQLVGTRVERLLHLDLVPGLRPVLLSEWEVQPEVINTEAFLKVLGEMSRDVELPRVEGPVAVLLGQYMSALSIITEDEEADLHRQMLSGAVARGHRTIIFKPHPTAAADLATPMINEAERLGVELHILREPMLAEMLFERLEVTLVLGCFSTAMMTAQTCFGIPAVRVGTELLLERLRPYENSNRIPVTLINALLPEVEYQSVHTPDSLLSPDRIRLVLQPLVNTVAYAMRPSLYPHLADEAQEFLDVHYTANFRYFKRRRLTSLGLPGALPPKPAGPAQKARRRTVKPQQLMPPPLRTRLTRVVRRARRLTAR